MFTIGQLLALASIAVFDAIVFLVCFAGSWLAFIYLLFLHAGSRRTRFLTGVAVTVVMTVIGFLGFRKLRGTVEVNPQTASFIAGSDDVYSFYIRNTRDVEVYNVVVELKADSDSANLSVWDFHPVVPQSSRKPTTSGSFTDDFTGYGCLDEEGKPNYQFTIGHMDPKEIRSLEVSSNIKGIVQGNVAEYSTKAEPQRKGSSGFKIAKKLNCGGGNGAVYIGGQAQPM